MVVRLSSKKQHSDAGDGDTGHILPAENSRVLGAHDECVDTAKVVCCESEACSGRIIHPF